MLHEPATPVGKDPASPYKTQIGVWMFWVYALIYAGFIGINLVDPTAMESIVFMGLNLATAYGFGLIVIALILALVYDRMCSVRERELAAAENRPEGQ